MFFLGRRQRSRVPPAPGSPAAPESGWPPSKARTLPAVASSGMNVGNRLGRQAGRRGCCWHRWNRRWRPRSGRPTVESTLSTIVTSSSAFALLTCMPLAR